MNKDKVNELRVIKQFRQTVAYKLEQLNAPAHAIKSIDDDIVKHIEEYRSFESPIVQFSINFIRRTRSGLEVNYEAITKLHVFTENPVEYYLI